MKIEHYWTFFIVLVLAFGCSSGVYVDEEDALDQANAHYQTEEWAEALMIIDAGIKQFGETGNLLHWKYAILQRMEDYESALVVFDKIIDQVGATPDVVVDKVRLLMNLERYEDALRTALEVDRSSEGSSQFISLFIARAHLAMSSTDKAIEWLEISHERGFTEFDYLLMEEFMPLHSMERFRELIERMKQDAGIGKALASFEIPLYDGNHFSSLEGEGKIMLLDFWATWCQPCVAEYENLKTLYAQYQDQGLEIISISADTKREALTKFLEEKPIPWVNGFSAAGPEDEVIQQFGIESLPTYMLVDRQGILRVVSGQGGEKLNRELELLLSEAVDSQI